VTSARPNERRVAKPSQWPAAIGNGLFAGACGTAFMTVSSTLEMRMRGRSPSDTPARAAAKVLGVEPVGEAERARFATIVHWSYGTSWGAVRGLIGAFGLRGPRAAALFFADVWGTELSILPALDIGVPPVWRWGALEICIDAFHHLVYASTASVAYELLDRNGRRASD
jgi:hypothetical protein